MLNIPITPIPPAGPVKIPVYATTIPLPLHAEQCPVCTAVNSIQQTAGPRGTLTFCAACGWEYLDTAQPATTPSAYHESDWVGHVYLGTD